MSMSDIAHTYTEASGKRLTFPTLGGFLAHVVKRSDERRAPVMIDASTCGLQITELVCIEAEDMQPAAPVGAAGALSLSLKVRSHHG